MSRGPLRIPQVQPPPRPLAVQTQAAKPEGLQCVSVPYSAFRGHEKESGRWTASRPHDLARSVILQPVPPPNTCLIQENKNK